VRWGIYTGKFLRQEGDQAVLLIGSREYRAPMTKLHPAGSQS
jgi:hypothetical protein